MKLFHYSLQVEVRFTSQDRVKDETGLKQEECNFKAIVLLPLRDDIESTIHVKPINNNDFVNGGKDPEQVVDPTTDWIAFQCELLQVRA